MDRQIRLGSQSGIPYVRGLTPRSWESSSLNRSCGPNFQPVDPSIAAKQYFTSTGRLDKYLERYLTRYHDSYIDKGHDEEATAMSETAVRKLASQLGPSSALHKAKSLTRAKVKILSETYSRCETRQGTAASSRLADWAEYVDQHLQVTVILGPGQQRFLQRLADQAESAAEELWQVYRACGGDYLVIRDYRSQLELPEAENRFLALQGQPNHHPPRVAATESRTDAIGMTNLIQLQYSETQGSLGVPGTMQPHNGNTKVVGYSDHGTLSPSSYAKTGIRSAFPKESSLSTLDDMRKASPSRGLDIRVMSPIFPSSAQPGPRKSSETSQKFNRIIVVFSAKLENVPVAAMFDTGNQSANCVSYELLTELGMKDKIRKCQKSDRDISGHLISYSGTIELRWQHYDEQTGYKYRKVHRNDFNVLRSKHIQVIFGEPYCRENNLAQFNINALAPLIPEERMPSGMQNQISNNKKWRDEKKKKADIDRTKVENMMVPQSYQKLPTTAGRAQVESASIQERHA